MAHCSKGYTLLSCCSLMIEWVRIVYSTCALSKLENDEVIRKLFQKRDGRFKLIRKEFSFGEPTEFGWQILPDQSGWGPFYLAIIERIK